MNSKYDFAAQTWENICYFLTYWAPVSSTKKNAIDLTHWLPDSLREMFPAVLETNTSNSLYSNHEITSCCAKKNPIYPVPNILWPKAQLMFRCSAGSDIPHFPHLFLSFSHLWNALPRDLCSVWFFKYFIQFFTYLSHGEIGIHCIRPYITPNSNPSPQVRMWMLFFLACS